MYQESAAGVISGPEQGEPGATLERTLSMKKTLSALALAASLALGANSAIAAEDTTAAGNAAKAETAMAKYSNPFDMSTWFSGDAFKDAGGHVKPGHTEKANVADPDFWMKWADPKSHTKMHMAFSNPATYGQMMNPSFYMAMMNPATWMKWMNPASYATVMNPATYAYWMQPGAYMHAMNPANYMQAMDPKAYTKMMSDAKVEQWMNPAAYTVGETSNSTAAVPNFFNPMAWMGMFAAPGSKS